VGEKNYCVHFLSSILMRKTFIVICFSGFHLCSNQLPCLSSAHQAAVLGILTVVAQKSVSQCCRKGDRNQCCRLFYACECVLRLERERELQVTVLVISKGGLHDSLRLC
jgi:hypothetical protein